MIGNASAYISLDEAKAYLRIAGSTFDEHINELIAPLSELCDDLTGRTFHDLGSGFETHGLTVRYHMTTLKRGIVFPEWPIQSIVGITHANVALSASQFRVNNRSGAIWFTTAAGDPQDLSGNLEITAIVGYPRVPRGVAIAVLRALSYIKQRADEEGLGSELLGPQQTTWRATMDHDSNELHAIMMTHIGRYELDNLTVLEEGEVF